MNSAKQWYLLTAVAVVAVLAAGWFLLVSPKHAEAADLRTQASDQARTTQQARTQLAVLQAQAKGLVAEQAKLALVTMKLPHDTAQPALIRALAGAADGADVEPLSIEFGKTIAAAAAAVPATTTTSTTDSSSTAASTAGTTAGTAHAGNLSTMSVTLSVAGGYFQIEQYLAALEDLPRAVRVTAVHLAPGDDTVHPSTSPTALTDGQHLVAAITAVVYVDASPAPAPVVAPALAPVSQETS